MADEVSKHGKVKERMSDVAELSRSTTAPPVLKTGRGAAADHSGAGAIATTLPRYPSWGAPSPAGAFQVGAAWRVAPTFGEAKRRERERESAGSSRPPHMPNLLRRNHDEPLVVHPAGIACEAESLSRMGVGNFATVPRHSAQLVSHPRTERHRRARSRMAPADFK